jgi:glycosyltransferase involved in cell wall biosynthesis
MDEKKVLVVSYYFPPMGLSGVQRTLKFVKYLPLYGWKSLVLTTSAESFYAFDESLTHELNEDYVSIYRTDEKKKQNINNDNKVKKFPSYFKQKIGRAVLQTIYQPDSKINWFKHAVKKGQQIIDENDIKVIFATAPPYTDFLVAKELSQKNNIPFIVDYRDVWIDNPFNFYATPFHKLYSTRLENDILTDAAKAIVTIRNTKELLLKRYRFLTHSDIDIITHGFDPDDFENIPDVYHNTSKFTLTHSGLFQDNRTPKYFLKAVNEFFKKKPEAKKITELRFIGIMRKSHLKMIKKLGLEPNTVLTDYLSHKDVIRHLLESDVLWFMLKDTVRSPGKLYEYFGAKKTILACIPEGSLRKQIEESESALITSPTNVKDITAGINSLYELWKIGKLPYPKSSFLEQYDRRQLTGELAKILEMTIEV